jgi:hypothetical protein
MEHVIDEAAVWQRVTAAGGQSGTQKSPTGQLVPGILDALGSAQRRLGRYNQLRYKYRLSQLIAETRQEIRQLRGLYLLYTGTAPPKAAGETASQGLRQLTLELERSAGRLEALSEHATGETAELLRELARQEKRQWRVLLELLGNGGVTAASRSPVPHGSGGSR